MKVAIITSLLPSSFQSRSLLNFVSPSPIKKFFRLATLEQDKSPQISPVVQPQKQSKTNSVSPVTWTSSLLSMQKSSSNSIERILQAEKTLSENLAPLSFSSPVTHVYDPLTYAWNGHEWYVRTYAKTGVKVVLVGMNPGPWGMAQTGVPFGEVEAVTNFMKMPDDIEISKPEHENSARPVDGLKCKRSEVSGRRLWREWAADHYDNDAHAFFNEYYVHNYCPLMFLESSGRNRTPVQLKAKERQAVQALCNITLREVVRALRPQVVCGVGAYARDRCLDTLKSEIDAGLHVGLVLHPSPASPAANRGWVEQATQQLTDLLQNVEKSEKNWTEILETD